MSANSTLGPFFSSPLFLGQSAIGKPEDVVESQSCTNKCDTHQHSVYSHIVCPPSVYVCVTTSDLDTNSRRKIILFLND